MTLGAVARRVGLVLGLLAFAPVSGAQPPARVYRLGYLCAGFCDPGFENTGGGRLFRQTLSELGYTEGHNLVIDGRGAGVPYDRLGQRASELVRERADVLLVEGIAAAQAAKRATRSVPIVMVGAADAVEAGLVGSLARPGGNVTGVSIPSADLVTKQLQLLRESIPALARVAVLSNPANPEHHLMVQAARTAGRALDVALDFFEARAHLDYERVFASIKRRDTAALLVLADPVLYGGSLTLFALRSRLATISQRRELVSRGAMMSYGPVQADLYRRAARYVDRILRGARPGDLPVEQPIGFELVINLSTAKALGVTIPQSLLMRADEVIQ